MYYTYHIFPLCLTVIVNKTSNHVRDQATGPSNISNELYEVARRCDCQLQLGNQVTNH